MLSVPYRMFFSSPILLIPVINCPWKSIVNPVINCQVYNQSFLLSSLACSWVVHSRICVSYKEGPAWESPGKGLYLILSTIDMPKNRLLGQASGLTELEQLLDWSDRQAAAQSSTVYCTKQIAYPDPAEW